MGDEKFNVVKDALSNHNRFFQFFTLEEIKHYIGEAAFEIITIKQYNEKEKHPNIGREEVDWIWCLARKR